MNTADERGNTPLGLAVASGREQIVDLLMKNGARPTDSLLHFATDQGT